MPRNATTRSGGSRFYVWGRGERYWSVTTILSALPKDALKFWAAKSVAEFAVDRAATWMSMSREEAVDWLKREPLRFTAGRADLGSAVHAAAKAYVIGQPVKGDWNDEERRAIGNFRAFLEALHPRVIAAETQIYNRTEKYAGTFDLIAEFPFDLLLALAGGNPALVPWTPREGRDSVTLMVDYKTGGDIEEGKGVYPETALQLAAYAKAEFIAGPSGQEIPVPELDGAAVVHVQAKGWRIVPADALRPDVFKTFLFVREVFRWQENISKEVLGVALEPAPPEPTNPHLDQPARPASPKPVAARRRRPK